MFDSGLRVKISLEMPNLALVNAQSSNSNQYTAYRPRLQLSYVILKDVIMKELMEASDHVLKVPSSSWSSSETSVGVETTSTLLLPFRFSSNVQLMTAMRDSGYTGTNINSIGSRSINKLQNWQYRNASNTFPPQLVQVSNADWTATANHGASETLAEVLKASHNLNSIDAEVCFDLEQFMKNGTDADGSFCLGVDLSGESHVSETLFSGYSSNDSNFFLDLQRQSDGGAPVAHTITSYSHYDVVFIITEDGAISRSM